MNLSDKSKIAYQESRDSSHCGSLCWAPSKSMFIGLRGNITTCCYNKTYLIGKFPEKTLQDIWFGAKRKNQVEALAKNDFSLGCHNCKRVIDAGNFKGLPAKNFDDLDFSEMGFPTKIDFELSNECNLECVMCRGEFSSSIRKNREKLPPIPQPYDADFLKELEAFIPHLKTGHFLGGEPFLIPIYEEIWELIKVINPEVRISIQTNATIISERTKKLINSMNFDIAVSIDSIEKVNYERIRKNANFEKVTRNIDYLRNTCRQKGTNFTLSYCPMPQNWQELGQVIEFANNLECKIYFNKVDHPSSCSFQSLESEDLEQILQFWNTVSFSETTEIEIYNKEAAEQVIKQVQYLHEMKISSPKVTSLQDYLIQLKEFIIEKEGANWQPVYSSIEDKLNFILDSFETTKQEAEEKLIAIDFQSLYEGLKSLDKEHAVHLFNAFILPLPSLNSTDV